MQRLLRPRNFRPLRRISTQTVKDEFGRLERMSTRCFRWYCRSVPFVTVLGGVVGTIYGSYQYYEKPEAYRRDDILEHGIVGTLVGLTWPVMTPFILCRGIGYFLSQGKKIKIKIARE